MALQARPLVLRVNEMDGLESTRGDLKGTGGTFLNIAHRGDSSRAPENTLAAFEAGVEAGASAVELDLRCTADGHVVVMHDESVDRTTDGTGQLEQLTLEQVRKLDAGGWFDERFAGEGVPTLAEVFDRMVDRVPLVLHIKEAGCGIERAVIEEVNRRGVVDRVSVSSDRRGVLESFHRLAPDLTTTWIAWFRDWRWWMWYVAGRVRRLQARRVAPPASQVTEAMVDYFHGRGIVVRAWGVGRDETLAARLISLGVDGMTFDDPRRLTELLNTAASTAAKTAAPTAATTDKDSE